MIAPFKSSGPWCSIGHAAALFVLTLALLAGTPGVGSAAREEVEPLVLSSDRVFVQAHPALQKEARDVIARVPVLLARLESDLGMALDEKPLVVLVHDHALFRRAAGTDRIVAFAVPVRKLIVIDTTRMQTHPFTLDITLIHELCHLLLHRHIPEENLPKWLDEGVAQLVSGGVSELTAFRETADIRAEMARRPIPFSRLAVRFPSHPDGLAQAYEQGRSMVVFLDAQFGRERLKVLLARLAGGEAFSPAVSEAFGTPFSRIEHQWLSHIRGWTRYLELAAAHMYDLLFVLAALLAILGYVKAAARRKRARMDMADDEQDLDDWDA